MRLLHLLKNHNYLIAYCSLSFLLILFKIHLYFYHFLHLCSYYVVYIQVLHKIFLEILKKISLK